MLGAGTCELRPISLPPTLRGFQVEAIHRSDSPEGRPAISPRDANAGEISLGDAERGPRRIVSEQAGNSRDFRPAGPLRSEQVSIPSVDTSAPAAIVVEARVPSHAEPARPPRPRPPAPPEATIHVTIGRIEVRATPPGAPTAPRERQAPTVMSLEDYLRRRARGSGQ